jgi:hypothetical protein
MTPGQRCIYCDSPADSKEHVIATRFIDLLSRDPRGLNLPATLTVNVPSEPPRRIGGKKNNRGQPTLEFTTRVCEQCNNEWMNDIDTTAWPYVSEMIQGHQVALDDAAREAIATWFMKVAITARSVPHVGQPIKREWAKSLYEHRSPIPGWQVWLGKFDGLAPFWYNPQDVHFEIGQGVPPRVGHGKVIEPHGVLATCVIGYLIVQVLGIDGVGVVDAPGEPALPLIWPGIRGVVSWPPREYISDAGLPRWAQRHVGNPLADLPTVSPRPRTS